MMKSKGKKNIKIDKSFRSKMAGVFLVGLIFLVLVFFGIPMMLTSEHIPFVSTETQKEEIADESPKWTATHLSTPQSLKGVYMTSWVAGTPSIRTGIIDLIDATELNAIIIDIKDDTGRISFDVYDKELEETGAEEIRISDLRELIELLHEKGVYVIGRISAFQDPYMVSLRPELAVKRSSDMGVWKDRKGISWIDAGSKEMWDYLTLIGKEAYDAGFDELNYDYIRFPSDGNMDDIYYPFSEAKIVASPDFGKADVLEGFFKHLQKEFEGSDVVLSADLFGMVTTNSDDLNIGQVLERALPYFDYIAPMVYPSHYPPTFIGLANPAAHPYEVIHYSMQEAVKKVEALKMSSSTPIAIRERVHKEQLRPWIQDFDLGAVYTADMVRKQMQATYDSGLTSWMLWNASNKYTREALLSQ